MHAIAGALACLAMLTGAGDVPADTDCTFDQAHQVEVMRAIAARTRGARFDAAENKVLVDGSRPVEFRYGGCVDFGSVVTQTTQRSKPRAPRAVLAQAVQLAKSFWDNDIVRANDAARALRQGLRNKAYTLDTQDGSTTWVIDAPSHLQLSVTHEHRDGIDRVTIAWQGLY